MDKRIKISIMAMRSAIQDKENLESLAFSILIKMGVLILSILYKYLKNALLWSNILTNSLKVG